MFLKKNEKLRHPILWKKNNNNRHNLCYYKRVGREWKPYRIVTFKRGMFCMTAGNWSGCNTGTTYK